MKNLSVTFFTFIAVVLIPLSISAQIELPQPSPKAKVMQTVGLTEITIEYSSPGLKGREGKIWGSLVPYGEVWRMGANQSTKISFSRDVKINDKELKSGTYSLGAIPGKEEWILIFSKTEELGGWDKYSEANDALRINVKPQDSDLDERFRFSITDFTNEKATVNMDWEKLRIPFDVQVNTDAQAWKSIEFTLNPGWRAYANAARYAKDERKDYQKALEFITKSVQLEQHWYNTWIKAQVHAEMKNYEEARKTAQGAMDLGLVAEKNGENFFYKNAVTKALEEWKDKK